MKLLVKGGADLNARNDNGLSPTEMLRVRPGDIPNPMHMDELWEETHDFLIETVTGRRRVESKVQRKEFAQRYRSSYRELHLDESVGESGQIGYAEEVYTDFGNGERFGSTFSCSF